MGLSRRGVSLTGKQLAGDFLPPLTNSILYTGTYSSQINAFETNSVWLYPFLSTLPKTQSLPSISPGLP